MENQNTPLWDASLDINERLDWLLEALNLDEKCRMFSTLTPEVARLGIRSTYLGEEAAHGVEAKHDRSVNWGAPKPTTTFPQPFGMSQTWDTKLMEKMGAAVGDEARILYYREGEHGGLCRWAPMAEPERDPRFGRTEEGFGEDPHLGGQMASAYIKEKHPTLVAICYDSPDHTGHTEGHDTPAYYEKLKELDTYVGQIVQAVKDAGILDDTIFILTSDHGGIKKGHGGKTMQEMETAFIISGKNIKKGLRFDDISMMQYDVASTIAHIFNLEQPQVWIGRPMKIVFK